MKTQLSTMLNSTADAWAAWMWPMAWHVTVLALVVAALAWLLRGRSARLRYALWLLIPIRLLLPPTLALATGWGWWLLPPAPLPVAVLAEPVTPIEPNADYPSPETEGVQSRPIEQEAFGLPEQMAAENANVRENEPSAAEPPQPIATFALSLPAWLFCGWLLGVGVLTLRLLNGCLCAAKMVRRAEDISLAHGRDTLELLESCRWRTGVKRAVRLCQLTEAGVPMLVGFVRPTIILPTGLDQQLTSQELEAVLVHELQHVARHDAIVHLGQSLLGVVYFFHPLVWLSNRLLNRLREDACDEATVAVLEGQRRNYGAGIVKVAKLMSGPTPSMSLGIVESGGQVKRRLRRILDPRLPVGRRLSWSAFALLLALAAVVLPVAARPGDTIDPGTTDVTNDKRSDPEPTNTAVRVDDDLVTIQGCVLDAAGKAVSRATVHVVRLYNDDPPIDHQPLAEATSDQEGRFQITYRKSQFDGDVKRAEYWRNVAVVALKAGYGPDWIWRGNKTPHDQPAEIRLAEDDQPITGRLLDLEGRPLAGVSVTCNRLKIPRGDNLSAWIEGIKQGETSLNDSDHFRGSFLPGRYGPASQRTDADGRFRLIGIGRERAVNLTLEGPTIARTEITVVTRPIAPLAQAKAVVLTQFPEKINFVSQGQQKIPVVGSDFEIALPPTRVIEGIVRDAETGAALAGVSVQSWKMAGTVFSGEREIRTVSDAEGHFRVVGMPKGENNVIVAIPNDQQPYFMRLLDVPDEPGLEPVQVALELHRGIWITGRVIDQATSKPVPMAELFYIPYRANEYAQALPEFPPGESRKIDDIHYYHDRYQTSADGTYRLVGLPGPAIVGLETDNDFCVGQGASDLGGVTDKKGAFLTFLSPGRPNKNWPTAMKEINPADASSAVELDFALDRGREIEVAMVDPAGRPLADVQVDGRESPGGQPTGSTFVAAAFGPREVRTILLQQRMGRLGKVVRLRGDNPAKKITAQLQPCAIVKGRLVDKNQVPVPAVHLRFDILSGEDRSNVLPAIGTDSEGRFEHSFVLPGASYQIVTFGVPIGIRTIVKELTIEPGETLDLGTIDITSDKRPEPVRTKPAADAGANAPGSKPADGAAKAAPADDDLITIPGRVLDSAGKPVEGATVRVVRQRFNSEPVYKPLAETSSDREGRFEISYRKSQIKGEIRRAEQWKFVTVSASKAGHGPGWAWINKVPLEEPTELRLPIDDLAITGSLVDLEGRPLAGVRVECGKVQGPKGDDLSAWSEAVKRGERNSWQHLGAWLLSEGTGLVPELITDADGRFRLTGVGRERMVGLVFEGSSIARTQITAVTRSMPSTAQMTIPDDVEKGPVVGADFQIAIPPTRVIEGVVRDLKTGDVLAGVGVQSWKFPNGRRDGDRSIRTLTDAQGHFRLVGMPKGPGNQIVAVPSDEQPYLMRTADVPDMPGLEPVNVDFELHRGIWITGRVTDRVTGKPVSTAELYYMPFLSNGYAQGLPEFLSRGFGAASVTADYQDRYQTGADGTYRLVGLPGLAIVEVFEGTDSYRVRQGASDIHWEKGERGEFSPSANPWRWDATAMKEINPAEGGAVTDLDFALDPGGQVEITAVDPAGQPITNLLVSGSTPRIGGGRLDSATFIATGLGPSEQRVLSLLHRQRGLGKSVLVRPEDQGKKITVQLETLARIKGRLVDQDHKPVTGRGVMFHNVPVGIPPRGIPLANEITNSDGGFDGTIQTGLSFTASVQGIPGNPTIVKELSAEPGETIDLGTIDVTSDKRPEPMRTKVAANGAAGAAGKKPAEATAAAGSDSQEFAGKAVDPADKPVQDGQLPAEQQPQAVVTGKMALADGKPAVAAHVAVIATRTEAGRGGDLLPRGEVLAEATTDDSGKYRLTIQGASSKTHRDANLIARQDGYAIAWQPLNLDKATNEASLTLAVEEPIRGRLVDIEGLPAAGVGLSVLFVPKKSNSGEISRDRVAYHGEKSPVAWPKPVTSDADGRFVLTGLSASQGAYLNVSGSDRFAPQNIALNTGTSEMRPERDMTYRSLIKNAAPGEEVVLPLSPAQWFEGQITFADTGQPAPHARLTIWASQQPVGGSMMSLAGQTDAAGRYRINPHPGVRFGIHAYPPDHTPYFAFQTDRSKGLVWNASDRVAQVNIKLPRGILVRGTVVEAGTDTPVAGAAVQYVPERDNNPHATDDVVTGWQAIQLTDEQGKFETTIFPGPGRLLVHGQQEKYVLQESSEGERRRGKPGGRREYAHAIERINPAVGADPIDVSIALQAGAAVTGTLVDDAGAKIEEALVISRLTISPLNLSWRGQTPPTLGGNFELSGLDPHQDYPVCFLDPQRHLGATQIVRAGSNDLTVVLKPCGQASVRYVDAQGQPQVGLETSLHLVITPGVGQYDFAAARAGKLAADCDFVANIDRINHSPRLKTDEQGRITFPALIPGAVYQLHAVQIQDRNFGILNEFTVKSGEQLDLGDVSIKP